MVVSHAGHTGTVQQIYSLEQQIAHKEHVLEYLSQQYENPNFVVMGHSVGAYISLKVIFLYILK